MLKTIFKILVFAIALIAVVVIGIFSFVTLKGIPSYEPIVVDFTLSATPELVEKGEKLSGMLCNHCHMAKGELVLTGRKVEDIDPAFGEVYSQNITQHPEKGIGNWSPAQIAVFVRTGVRPDGSYAPPYMPKFPLMADEDLRAIISFLKSESPLVRPNEQQTKRTEPSFMTKMLSNLVFKPLPYPQSPIPLPDTTNQVELGKYLSTAQLGCFHCHSADFKTNNELQPEQSVGFFGGGNLLFNMKGQKVLSPNITVHPETGIGKWTEFEFVEAVRFGRLPNNGGVLKYPMLPYSALSETEVKSIYAYLQTVTPIENEVAKVTIK